MFTEVPQVARIGLYCGPTAICAVTGLVPATVIDAIQTLRDSTKPVRGMSNAEMFNVLGFLGYRIEAWEPTSRRTVRKHCLKHIDDRPQIVSVYRHFVAHFDGDLVDNWSDGMAIPVELHAARNRIVELFFYVRKVKCKSVSL